MSEATAADGAGSRGQDEAAVTRQELHLRRIEMRGFARSDGLYEVEGRVVDTKTRDFTPPSNGRFVAAGEPIHDMGVRLVFDDEFTVHAIETFTDASPYGICGEGGRALQSMVGVRMVSGWSAEVRKRLAGPQACTHLMELLMPMATTAFQALAEVRLGRPPKVDARGRPLKIDSCYAYGASREVVRRMWPAFHEPESAQK
jgi:Protein of unknown function (DUF2889)